MYIHVHTYKGTLRKYCLHKSSLEANSIVACVLYMNAFEIKVYKLYNY